MTNCEASRQTWLRRLAPGEIDHEAIWLGLSAICLLAAVGWVHFSLPVPECAFRRLTGYPCPTCGATRCVALLLHGRATAAFLMNPLVFMGLVGVALFDLYALAALALNLPRLRPRGLSPAAAWTIRAGVAAALAANWIYVIFLSRTTAF